MYYHARLILYFLIDTGFLHVGQAGLELLTSGDLPASTSQSAGVSHRARPPYRILTSLSLCQNAFQNALPGALQTLSLSSLDP